MKYLSTRNKKLRFSASEVIVKGISDEGGLFVPESFPVLDEETFRKLSETDYPHRAAYVLSLLMDDFSEEELLDITTKAYSRFDDLSDPCPLVEIDDNLFILELWHGPTLAFKDMALTVLPHLLTASRKKTGHSDKTLILVATSGDTGKAALEGFKDVEGVDIIVFYPSEGVSEMQKLQMTAQKGNNVSVFGINGNFDDAQNAVKKIFTDKDCIKAIKDKGYSLSSANSINWGRLAPQIAYYISVYADLLSSGKISFSDKINITVPTGNFGNILAAYYAYKMGLPVNKLICASNINNILTDFLTEGVYDTKREFHKTISPSMDILISSNLERLLFDLYGDDKKISELMKDLKEKGKYKIDSEILSKIKSLFAAGFASEEETLQSIANYFEEYGYLIDTHTAVACSVESDYEINNTDSIPAVIVSTASPYKFPSDVLKAAGGGSYEQDAFKAVKKLHSLSALEIPDNIKELKNADIRFKTVINKDNAFNAVLDYLNSKRG